MSKPTIIVIGLGWGSASFIKNINTDKYNVKVYSINNKFIYTPLLAQNIKNNKALVLHGKDINDEVIFESREIYDVDFVNKFILDKNNKIKYDYLIFSHGADVNTFNIPGVKEHCYFIKDDIQVNNLRKQISSLPLNSHIAVIGCGLTGAETIGTLLDFNKFNIHAIDALPRPLMMFDEKLSNFTLRLWKNNNIKLYMNHMVSSINNNSIEFKNNSNLKYNLAIWCGGIKKAPLTDKILTKLNLSNNKGIPVNNFLKVENTKNVFAIGDCAVTGFPPTAQVAYQEGQYLAKQFNSNFKHKEHFNFNNKGQIGYIGLNQSIVQIPYFQSGGNLIYYLNKGIHLYNGINFKQRINILFT